jgi:hypothetical protein
LSSSQELDACLLRFLTSCIGAQTDAYLNSIAQLAVKQPEISLALFAQVSQERDWAIKESKKNAKKLKCLKSITNDGPEEDVAYYVPSEFM